MDYRTMHYAVFPFVCFVMLGHLMMLPPSGYSVKVSVLVSVTNYDTCALLPFMSIIWHTRRKQSSVTPAAVSKVQQGETQYILSRARHDPDTLDSAHRIILRRVITGCSTKPVWAKTMCCLLYKLLVYLPLLLQLETGNKHAGKVPNS